MGWLALQGIAGFQERDTGEGQGKRRDRKEESGKAERGQEKTDVAEEAEGARGRREGFARSPVWMIFQFLLTWAY